MRNLLWTISSHEESPTSTTERHFCVPFCFRLPFAFPCFVHSFCPRSVDPFTPIYCAYCQRFLFRAVGRAVINANVLAKRVAAHPWNEEGGKDHFSTATCYACAYFLHSAPRLSAHHLLFFLGASCESINGCACDITNHQQTLRVPIFMSFDSSRCVLGISRLPINLRRRPRRCQYASAVVCRCGRQRCSTGLGSSLWEWQWQRCCCCNQWSQQQLLGGPDRRARCSVE